MLKPIRALLPAGLAHIATRTADVTVDREYTKPKKNENIWMVLLRYLKHPGVAAARPSQPLIDLIVSNYATDFVRFCSVALGGEGESMRGI